MRCTIRVQAQSRIYWSCAFRCCRLLSGSSRKTILKSLRGGESPECETSTKGAAQPEREKEDLSTVDYNTLNDLCKESQTTETEETVPQEVGEELITPTRVKTIQHVLAQADAKRRLCALRLLTHFFSKEELAESNTDGGQDKRVLDSGKLNSLKILVFGKFPASNRA